MQIQTLKFIRCIRVGNEDNLPLALRHCMIKLCHIGHCVENYHLRSLGYKLLEQQMWPWEQESRSKLFKRTKIWKSYLILPKVLDIEHDQPQTFNVDYLFAKAGEMYVF